MIYSDKDLIMWSGTFACGIKLIDEQHKELVNMINEMFMHVTGSEKEERAYFNKIIHKAVNYIKIHFATEEKILAVTKFPGYREHKLVHDSFTLNIIETINELTSGKHMSLYSFTKYLKEWVFSHIAVMDKNYFQYIRTIATRKKNGKLSVNQNDVQYAEDLHALQ